MDGLLSFSDDLLLMGTPPCSRSSELSQTTCVSSNAALSGTLSAGQELDKLFTCSPQTCDQESNVRFIFHLI